MKLMENGFDLNISKGNTFLKIAMDLVKNMLYTGSTVKKTYIDINSCVSVLFRLDTNDRNNETMDEYLKTTFHAFIEESLKENKELIFLYTTERSSVHVDIYPEWMIERNTRVDLKNYDPLTTILYAIKLYSKDESRIKLVNIKRVHPALVVRKNEEGNKNRYLILSKDNVFKTMTDKKLDLFDGKNYYTNQFNFKRYPDNIEIPEPEVLLPYYMAIRGSSREGYFGVPNMGPNRTKNYLEAFRLNIKADTDHKYKEVCDKYATLFDLNKLMLLNKEQIPII